MGQSCTSGRAEWWQENAFIFSPSLVRYVNEQVETRHEDLLNIADLYRLMPIAPSV